MWFHSLMELPARKQPAKRSIGKKNVSATSVPRKYQKGRSSAESVARALDFDDENLSDLPTLDAELGTRRLPNGSFSGQQQMR